MLVVRQIVVWRNEEFLLMLIFFSCWIRHTSNVDYCINCWSCTDFIVEVEKKCWTADWLLMLVVILIRWILHHSAYHRAGNSHLLDHQNNILLNLVTSWKVIVWPNLENTYICFLMWPPQHRNSNSNPVHFNRHEYHCINYFWLHEQWLNPRFPLYAPIFEEDSISDR